MRTRHKRFELWHTFVTLFALNLCLLLTFSPFLVNLGVDSIDSEDHFLSVTRLAQLGWLLLVLSPGLAACCYLVLQLGEQARLLFDQVVKKNPARSRGIRNEFRSL